MTSDTSQTSSLAWQQEDARSLQCNFFPVNLVFEVIFFKFSANPALLNQNPTFKQKSFHPPPQDILPGRVTGSENPEKLETLHCSQQPITVPLVPHKTRLLNRNHFTPHLKIFSHGGSLRQKTPKNSKHFTVPRNLLQFRWFHIKARKFQVLLFHPNIFSR